MFIVGVCAMYNVLHVSVGVWMPQHGCRDQRTPLWSWLSLSTSTMIPGIDLRKCVAITQPSEPPC